MMTSIAIYVRRGRRDFRHWLGRSGVRAAGAVGGSFLGGLILSAGALAGQPMPLGLGLVMGLGGIPSLAAAVGSCAGFRLFWGETGLQGMIWIAAAWVLARMMAKQQVGLPLIGTLGAFIVASAGLGFQIWLGDMTTIPVYLLRVALGAGSAVLFRLIRAGFGQRRKTLLNSLGSAGYSKNMLAAAFAAADILPTARAEQLSLAQFAALADALTE